MKILQPISKLSNFSGRPGPLVLIIMDGIGIGEDKDNNAVYLADTPYLDSLKKLKLWEKKRILRNYLIYIKISIKILSMIGY